MLLRPAQGLPRPVRHFAPESTINSQRRIYNTCRLSSPTPPGAKLAQIDCHAMCRTFASVQHSSVKAVQLPVVDPSPVAVLFRRAFETTTYRDRILGVQAAEV